MDMVQKEMIRQYINRWNYSNGLKLDKEKIEKVIEATLCRFPQSVYSGQITLMVCKNYDVSKIPTLMVEKTLSDIKRYEVLSIWDVMGRVYKRLGLSYRYNQVLTNKIVADVVNELDPIKMNTR